MIFLHDIYIETQEQLDIFIKEIWNQTPESADKNLINGIKLYEEYLRNIFRLSLKLQDSVQKDISNDLYTCVIIPFKETDDFDSLDFVIAAEDDREIRKREMILFRSYCDRYFKSTMGLMSLFERYFN